jgi:hypothetical protein
MCSPNIRIKKVYPLKIILIAICFLFTGKPVLSQNCNIDSLPDVQMAGDTVYVFQENTSQQAVILENLGKKIKVNYIKGLSDFNNHVKSKYVFTPISKHSQPFPTALRFRYADEITADDVILKGTVLGFNSNYFLLELSINNGVKIVMKHKSEIVQNDLKIETPDK